MKPAGGGHLFKKIQIHRTGGCLENQVEMCRQYCRLHLEVDPQDLLIYEDEGAFPVEIPGGLNSSL